MKKILSMICLILAIIFALGTIGCMDTDPAAAGFGVVCTIVLILAWLLLRKGKRADTPTKATPAKRAVSAKTTPVKTTAAPMKATTTPRSHASGLPELPGHAIKYTYDEVQIAMSDKFFPIVDLQFDDLLTLKQEPENTYDPQAVAVYRGEDQLGYMYRGKLQDMVNDWIDKGRPVYGLYEASTDIETFTLYFFS